MLFMSLQTYMASPKPLRRYPCRKVRLYQLYKKPPGLWLTHRKLVIALLYTADFPPIFGLIHAVYTITKRVCIYKSIAPLSVSQDEFVSPVYGIPGSMTNRLQIDDCGALYRCFSTHFWSQTHDLHGYKSCLHPQIDCGVIHAARRVCITHGIPGSMTNRLKINDCGALYH